MARRGEPWKAAGLMLVLYLLSACSTVSPVTLQNATTGKKVSCAVDTYSIYFPAEGALIHDRQQRCISDYQRQGYERVPE